MVIFIVIVLDQVSKFVAITTIDAPTYVTSWFNLVLVMNPGVSFGMFGGLGGWGPIILSIVAIGVSAFLFRWLWQGETRLQGLSLGLIIGGAIGNVIDRIRFGAVVDFIDWHYAGWHWPAFNVADAAIVVGAGLMILDQLLYPPPDETAKK